MTEELNTTDFRLRVVLIVEELAKASPTGMARWGDIIDKLTAVDGTFLGSAKMLLSRTHHSGWLERPFYGCYRVTVEAYKALEKAGIEV